MSYLYHTNPAPHVGGGGVGRQTETEVENKSLKTWKDSLQACSKRTIDGLETVFNPFLAMKEMTHLGVFYLLVLILCLRKSVKGAFPFMCQHLRLTIYGFTQQLKIIPFIM
jgi:hypothetical protein